MEQDFESIVMELIVHGGDARSLAIQAIREAREGNFAEADAQMEACEAAILKGHEIQTDVIRSEINGSRVQMTLLMVHAQDHLMDAMTVKDLAAEMIAMMKKENREENGK